MKLAQYAGIILAVIGLGVSWLAHPQGWPPLSGILGLLGVPALLAWLGAPWRLRSQAQQSAPALSWLTISTGLIILGVTLQSALLPALGACLALGLTLNGCLCAADRRRIRRLVPWLILAAPVFLTDLAIVGWWFRLTGAQGASLLLNSAGFHAETNGTVIALAGDDLVVAPACAGLSTLHLLLLAGLIATTRRGRSPQVWWRLLIPIALLAWVANTLRITALGIIATSFGPDAARGMMHDFGGLAVILVAIGLALAVRVLLRRSPDDPPWWRPCLLTGSLITAVLSIDLLGAMTIDPKAGSNATTLLIWLLPAASCLVAALRQGDRVLPIDPRLIALGCILAVAGSVISIRILTHAGLAVTVIAWMPAAGLRWVYLAGWLAWEPALAWWWDLSPAVRLSGALVTAASAAILAHRLPETHASLASSPSRIAIAVSRQPRQIIWACLGMGTCLVVLLAPLVLWHTTQPPDASKRLNQMPLTGLGFSATDISLDPHAQAVFAHARVLRREYRFGGQRVLLTVIDGSKDRHAVHDPTICLRGAGWTISTVRPVMITNGDATIAEVHQGGETQEISWWYSDGTSRWSAPSRYWWHSALRRLTAGRLSDAAVLIIAEPLDGRSVDPVHLFEQLPDLALL